MKLLHEFADDIYPRGEITYTKNTSRAVVINEENKMALIKMIQEGFADCYITPGGGIEPGETPEEAVLREVQEELGVHGEILQEVGTIIDYFYDMKRKTVSHYFILKVLSYGETNFTDAEKHQIRGVEWLSLPDAINRLETYPADPRGSTFHRRDILAITKARRMMMNSSLA